MEAYACIELFRVALENGFPGVVIVTDSLNTIQFAGQNGVAYRKPSSLTGNKECYVELVVAADQMQQMTFVSFFFLFFYNFKKNNNKNFFAFLFLVGVGQGSLWYRRK